MENILFDKMLEVENKYWWFVARRKIISRIIETLDLGFAAKIFDAGCGNGDNLEVLNKFGAVVAMERETTALQNAINRKIADVYSGELPDNIPEEIPGNNNLIVLLDVLEHIDDDKKCLVNLENYLESNGYLLITVPAYQFLWTHRDDLHHHKRRYNKSTIKELFSNTKLRIEYISYFNTLLFPLALIERLLKKIMKTKNNNDLNMPGNFINFILEKIFSLEQYIVGKVSLPFGLSIILLARKT